MIELLPAYPLLLAAVLVNFGGPTWRLTSGVTLAAIALVLVWFPDAGMPAVPFLGYELDLVNKDALSRVFGTVFAIMAAAGLMFSAPQGSRVELSAACLYAGSALGAVFAGDLVTLFLFWELMAVGSTVVIWSGGTQSAYQAGMRYAILHFVGGVVLFAGLTLHILQAQSVALTSFDAGTLSGGLILVGFLINAAAPPLSAWVADAYPESSPFGMVFLSAFTTKTAVYALMRGFPGEEILIVFGLFMAVYGIVYALLENDMRRILAYSIVNQVGFMVTGIGIGTELALNGAAAHAFAHIIYKALLLMSAGAVLYQTGKRKCTDLGGLIHSMPVTAFCGIVGALAISAFPFTSGFISKSMISSAAAKEHLTLVWMLLTAASAGVFLHAGIKFPWFVFFQKDSGLRPSDPPMNMQVAMWLLVAICLGLGLFPGLLYEILPYPVKYKPYTADHLVAQLQLLLFAGLAFFVLLPQMKRTLTISLDFDWLYRKLLPGMGAGMDPALAGFGTALNDAKDRVVAKAARWVQQATGEGGVLAADWSTRTSSIVLLLVFIVVLGARLL